LPVRGAELLQRCAAEEPAHLGAAAYGVGLDLQAARTFCRGDANYVRKEKAEQLRDDVRRVLREIRSGYTGLVARGLTVDVRIREESDFQPR